MTEEKLTGCLIALAVPFVILYDLWAKAFVLRQVWEWFAVPLGLPAAGIRACVGLVLVVSVLSNYETTPKEAKHSDAAQGALFLLRPWVLLATAWVANWWLS